MQQGSDISSNVVLSQCANHFIDCLIVNDSMYAPLVSGLQKVLLITGNAPGLGGCIERYNAEMQVTHIDLSKDENNQLTIMAPENYFDLLVVRDTVPSQKISSLKFNHEIFRVLRFGAPIFILETDQIQTSDKVQQYTARSLHPKLARLWATIRKARELREYGIVPLVFTIKPELTKPALILKPFFDRINALIGSSVASSTPISSIIQQINHEIDFDTLSSPVKFDIVYLAQKKRTCGID